MDRLAEARLLIKDRRIVRGEEVEVTEVAHEALLREWKDLNTALLEQREFLVLKGQLEQDVAEWQATPEDRKKGALLAENKLARARQWLVQRPQDLTAEERRFIQVSADAEEARRQRQWMAAASAFILIAAVAVFAGLQWQKAEERLREALRNESLYQAEQANRETVRGDAVTGMLLALEGLPDTRSDDEVQRTRPYVSEVESALYAAWQARNERVILAGHTSPVLSALFSPDGSRILTASADNTARLWDAEGKWLAALEGHTSPVDSAVFSPDGSRILTASEDNTARLWDAEGKRLATLEGHTSPVVSAVFSPADGSRILTASADNTARLWKVFPDKQALVDRVKEEVPRCLTRQTLHLTPKIPTWCETLRKWPFEAGATHPQ